MQQTPKQLARQRLLNKSSLRKILLLLTRTTHPTTISPPNPAPKAPKKKVQHLVYSRLPLTNLPAAQSVEGPSTDHASSDKKLPTQFNTKNPKKKGAAAPRVASLASTRRSTRSRVVSSTLGSGKKLASAKDYNDGNKVTRRERSATIAAKALFEQLQISDEEDTDFDGDPQADGASNDDLEMI